MKISCKSTTQRLASAETRSARKTNWHDSVTSSESTLHQIAPYIGKIKSSICRDLIEGHSKPFSTIYDPFCGSGSVAVEGWFANRNVIGIDLNPYATLLTQAKLFPNSTADDALNAIEHFSVQTSAELKNVDLRSVPKWVRAFFHPQTLREAIAWSRVLLSYKRYFLLGCLLGILHHQRPGFLSFPSSHTVPYLRTNKFPRRTYPKLYEYRGVRDRLESKVVRAFRRIPETDDSIIRICQRKNAAIFIPPYPVDTIITSPPYMGKLDYGRDNRLRLWFLGVKDWARIDDCVSLNEKKFLRLMYQCFRLWLQILPKKGSCVLVVGDNHIRSYGMMLPDALIDLATKQIGGYHLADRITDYIPNARRVRRNCRGNMSETVIVLKRV